MKSFTITNEMLKNSKIERGIIGKKVYIIEELHLMLEVDVVKTYKKDLKKYGKFILAF